MSSTIDYCLLTEIQHILQLQSSLGLQAFFENLSYYMSPIMVMTVWIPLIGAFDSELLIDLMFLVSCSMFGSSLIKWVVREPRPFWWIQDTKIYTSRNRPSLKVFPYTCETTSGSLSTHSFVFTVFLLVLAVKLIDILSNYCDWQQKGMKFIFYTAALASSVLMWVSRMYLATHFLHQCVAGSILGAVIVYYYYKYSNFQISVTDTRQKEALIFAVICSALVTLLYGVMLVLGVDVQWSVRAAFKWCTKPDYLNPNTTPVYGIIRDLALIFGLACAAPLAKKKEKRLNLFLSTPATLAIIAGYQALDIFTPTNFGRLAFLAYVFIRHYAFSYAIAHLIPKYCEEKGDVD